MKFSIIALTGLLTAASCSPTVYAVHEKREFGNPKWVSSDVELDSRFILPLSIGLAQQNLDKGHDFLMDVSDPKSPNYANHWTPEQVR
jgi:tripeptidyl-peptidase-1